MSKNETIIDWDITFKSPMTNLPVMLCHLFDCDSASATQIFHRLCDIYPTCNASLDPALSLRT